MKNKILVSTAVFSLGMLLLNSTFLAAETINQEIFPAKLVKHAYVPASTFVMPPADAPKGLEISGRFTTPDSKRTDYLYSIEGKTWLAAAEAPRTTGLYLPFIGQPVQGFSGIKTLDNGDFMVLSDNGFGSKRNSPDAMLMAHLIRPDWEQGHVKVANTIYLHDSERIIPFKLVNEHTQKRYLTGSDFDLEGMQIIGEQIWFGDEFGPYIFATDLEGKVLAFYEVEVDSKIIRSPDNHSIRMPSVPGEVTFEVRRSRGLEGMASSPDGKYLYPMLEGPLWDAEKQDWQNIDGRQFLKILEFNIETREFTGQQWKYLLEINGNNIGDFNMISPTRGLVIERDNGEGDPRFACTGEYLPNCFNVPAKFKRVYLIDFAASEDGFVKKIGYVDLMNINDANGVAQVGTIDNIFTFPFVTVESVDMVDNHHIIVGNDNNLPFSTGRTIGRADNNELIILYVGDMLKEELNN